LPIERAAIREHLEALYGTADAGFVASWHNPTKTTTWLPATDLDAIAREIEQLGMAGNIYHGVGLHEAGLGPSTRGTVKTVCAIPGLWLDLDIGVAGHAATARPPDVEAALALIRDAVALPASYTVASGGGLHVYWLFHEVWHFESDEERAYAAFLVESLQAAVRREAAKHGWSVDATHDLSRVLRPAGTINRKAGLPERPVTILQAVNQRYGVDEIARVLPLDVPTTSSTIPRRATRRGPATACSALWRHITAQCPFLRHCVDDAATLSEPEWHAALTVLACCDNGEAISHDISAPYPQYTAQETQQKFAAAQQANAPLRCATIRAHRSGESWCSQCGWWGRLRSPIELGYVRGYRYEFGLPLASEGGAR